MPKQILKGKLRDMLARSVLIFTFIYLMLVTICNNQPGKENLGPANKKNIVAVYCSVARSVLEYVVWHPGLTA